MAVKKGVFNDYVKAREATSLTDILNKKKQYTHNRVFDDPSINDSTLHKAIETVKKLENNSPVTVNTEVSERNTNSGQTVDKHHTSNIQTVNKPNSEYNTNSGQTVDRYNINASLSRLCGAQRKIVLSIYKNCRINSSNVTQELTIDHLLSLTGIKKNTIKTSILRLKKKGCLFLVEYKDGRSGWSKYSLSKELFNDIMHHENEGQAVHNNRQTVDKPHSKPHSEPGTATPSNSSNNINTTTKNVTISEEWAAINLEPLQALGFSSTQLKQLVGKNTPEIVQESINHFSFGLTNNSKVKQYSHPLNVLMGVLRKGQAWIEPNYQSPQEIAQRQIIESKKTERERLKQLEEDAYKLALEEWRETLSSEQLEEIAPLKKTTGDLMPEHVKISIYFKENVWPEKKKEYLVDDRALLS